MQLLKKSYFYFVFLYTCIAHSVSAQQNANYQLVFKQYDNQRNNKVIYEYVFPFQEGEVSIRNTKWQVEIKSENVPLEKDLAAEKASVTFSLLEGEIEGAWSIQQKINDWSSDNYLLMPGIVYGGNRFEVRKMKYAPRVWDPRDMGPDSPPYINDIPRLNNKKGTSRIQLTSGGMAFPAISYRKANSGKFQWWLTQQANDYGDYLFSIEESNDRGTAWISITSPAVREDGQYKHSYGIGYISTDKPVIFEKGEKLSITFWDVQGKAEQLTDFFTSATQLRELAEGKNDLLEPYLPLSTSFEIQEKKFNEQSWMEEYSYYASAPLPNRTYQVGWVGGTLTTYPLWVMGGDTTHARIKRNFDWLFPDRITDLGFFWDKADRGNQWIGGHGLAQEWQHTRKLGDGLFFVLKNFLYMQATNEEVKSTWSDGGKTVADAFVRLWEKEKQFGQWFHYETGEITVGGTGSAAIVPGAMVLANRLYKDPKYLKVAKESAQHFYDNLTKKGLTYGGPGDALAAPDSESAYALVVSYTLLYEETKEEKYLEMAQEAAHQFMTWVVSYNYEFPETSTFGKFGMPSKGAVIANSQNTHAAAGICTHSGVELLKLYRETGNASFLEVLVETVRIMPHNLNQGERIFPGMKEGWMTERINLNDYMDGIGEYFPGSTWAESAMLLANAELPGIYADLEVDKLFVFDHVEAELVKKGKRWFLKVHNPTKHNATVTIVAEDTEDKAKAWNDFYRIGTMKINVEAGKSKEVRIQ